MIQVKEKSFLLLFFFFVLSTMAQAFFAYYHLTGEHATDNNNIFIAQSIFFSSIILSLFIVLSGHWVLSRSRSIDQELDKLGDGSERNGYVALRAEKNLGVLGMKINRIVASTIKLGELRRKHIVAQTSLIALSYEHCTHVWFATNVQGQIKFISRGALAYFNVKAEDRFDLHINKIASKFNFEKALSLLLKREGFYTEESLTAYAAFDDEALPHYLFFTLAEEEHLIN